MAEGFEPAARLRPRRRIVGGGVGQGSLLGLVRVAIVTLGSVDTVIAMPGSACQPYTPWLNVIETSPFLIG